MNEVKFKYQKQIDELLALGCQLPELIAPNNLRACRFAKKMRKIEGYNIDYDFSSFRKIADLIYFEGPLLSHYVSSKGDDYLFYWVDRDESDNRWMVLRVSLASLQKYMAGDVSLLELIGSPNDGYLYLVDVDNNINYHNVKLVQPADLPEDYLPAADSFYAFEPIPAEDADELMTYELTIPYKERSRFEDFLQKIGFPVSALKKVVSRAAVF